MLPVLSGMAEEAGYRPFVLLRLPLYAALLRGILESGAANSGPIFVRGAFFVVHLLLYVLRRDSPENRFGSVLSWALILGAGTSTAIDLMLIL